jgi:acyl-CoA synthetase (AMP-forming)/AMP-acid ligase II
VPDGGGLGEVEVRGPSVFSGYLNGAGDVNDQGWFRTGDLGEWTDDGELRLLGRRGVDLIKTGGHRVGAGEVEDVLLAHPAVAEVAVAGVPDDMLGERVVAWVVPSEEVGVRELDRFTADRLVPYKRPADYVLVNALPRNELGKIQKRRLTAGAQDRL